MSGKDLQCQKIPRISVVNCGDRVHACRSVGNPKGSRVRWFASRAFTSSPHGYCANKGSQMAPKFMRAVLQSLERLPPTRTCSLASHSLTLVSLPAAHLYLCTNQARRDACVERQVPGRHLRRDGMSCYGQGSASSSGVPLLNNAYYDPVPAWWWWWHL